MNSPVLDWVPDLWAFLRRNWRLLLGGTTLAVGLAVVYLLAARATFTASSVLMVDIQAAAPFQQQGGFVDSAYTNGLAESEVEILQSMGIARQVVRMLQLQDNKQFLANGQSLVGWAIGAISQPFAQAPPVTAISRETAAAEILGRMIHVRRMGLSFILELDVATDSADLSAALNNALVDAFVLSGIEAKSANSKRASVWLEQRIAELQGQATAADRAVQDFKAEARIVDTDKGLMDEQHIGELTSQVVLARARVADATARRARIQEIIASGEGGEGVSAELDNLVIVHLREQYADAANQAAQLTARVGPNHDSVVQLRVRLQDLKLQIRSELDRIAQGTESDYKVALANQSDLQRQLDGLVKEAEKTNYSMVRLRELQSAADTYKALYADFLQRYTEAVQNQSFPISNIRVVTRSVTPLRQSWPRAALVLGAALAAGIALSLTAALVRESFDKGIRTATQVLSGLGLPCLGMLPTLKLSASDARARRWQGAVANSSVDPRLIAAPAILRQVMLHPFSSYGEAIRGLRFKLGRRSEGRRDGGVIGFASAQSGEGKTTVSANFAFFLAGAGFRTLLVDWDLRRQSLSQTLSPGAAGRICRYRRRGRYTGCGDLARHRNGPELPAGRGLSHGGRGWPHARPGHDPVQLRRSSGVAARSVRLHHRRSAADVAGGRRRGCRAVGRWNRDRHRMGQDIPGRRAGQHRAKCDRSRAAARRRAQQGRSQQGWSLLCSGPGRWADAACVSVAQASPVRWSVRASRRATEGQCGRTAWRRPSSRTKAVCNGTAAGWCRWIALRCRTRGAGR